MASAPKRARPTYVGEQRICENMKMGIKCKKVKQYLNEKAKL